jgi:UDP-glucose 4-epimerase
MSEYLVTGAAGFIGNHLVQKLAREGHSVLAVDSFLHPNAKSQIGILLEEPRVKVLKLDLSHADSVSSLPKVDGVYHLAALNGTQNFYSHPWKTLWNTTVPTVMLLNHYAKLDPDFFFYAGSSEAYASSITDFSYKVPTPEEVPLGISDPKEPRWSYGASKLHGEIACFAAQVEFGLPVVVGRFHNAYGPRMGIKHVIPDFINRGKEGVYELYGASNTRSFIFIDDAVDAILSLSEKAQGEIVNIGSPHEVSMRDLAKIIMTEAGWKGEVVEFDSPPGSVMRRAPDTQKLRNFVDVDAFVVLEEGIKRTVDYYLGK